MPAPVLLALLALAAAPAVRVAIRRPVWREARNHPVLAGLGLGGLVVTGWAGWWLYQRAPVVLPVAVTALVVADAFMWIRARPSWGRRRGLPPGSLGVGPSLDALSDPDFYARSARRWGPVFKMAQFHRPVACIADLALGLRVLEEHRTRLRQPRLPFGRLSPGNYIEFMNDELHARYRSILRTALSGRVVRACRDGVGTVVQARLEAIARDSGSSGVRPLPYLDDVAFAAMTRVMCGVAVDGTELRPLRIAFEALGAQRPFLETRPEERVEPYDRLVDWMKSRGRGLLDSVARDEPVPASVLSEILRADPAHLDDEILLGNLVLIVHVTRSNVRGVLGWVLKEAVDHPRIAEDLLDTARGDPVRARAKAAHFVDETLRLHQSEYFYREVAQPIDFEGFRIPRDWLLRVCVREAHDDPRIFEAPRSFDPSRFGGRSYDKTEYCPFSDGAHSCFGAGLALMIARVFLLELVQGFEAQATSDGPMERQGNRHWSHWQPSSHFRLSLRPRPRAG